MSTFSAYLSRAGTMKGRRKRVLSRRLVRSGSGQTVCRKRFTQRQCVHIIYCFHRDPLSCFEPCKKSCGKDNTTHVLTTSSLKRSSIVGSILAASRSPRNKRAARSAANDNAIALKNGRDNRLTFPRMAFCARESINGRPARGEGTVNDDTVPPLIIFSVHAYVTLESAPRQQPTSLYIQCSHLLNVLTFSHPDWVDALLY